MIDLKGIVSHDVIISIIGNERKSIWFYTVDAHCINDLNSLPFHVRQNKKGEYVCFPPVDVIALAERIALSWEQQGIKVERRITCWEGNQKVQSFVLA